MQMPNMPSLPAGIQMPAIKTTQCITADQAKDPANTVPRQTGRGRGGKDDCKLSDYKTTGRTISWSMAPSPANGDSAIAASARAGSIVILRERSAEQRRGRPLFASQRRDAWTVEIFAWPRRSVRGRRRNGGRHC